MTEERQLADFLIQRQRHIPPGPVNDFVSDLHRLGISTQTHEADPAMCAGLELYLPTAVVVFIGSAFITRFVGEAAKDAYNGLKRAITALLYKFGTARTKIATAGNLKIDPNSPYSLIISIYLRDARGRRFKFLIPVHADEETYAGAADAFLRFLQRKTTSKVTVDGNQRSAQLELMTYDAVTHEWRPLSRETALGPKADNKH